VQISEPLVMYSFKPSHCSNYATGRTTDVRFPAEAEIYSLRHRIQTVSGAHPAFYSRGTGICPRDKAAGSWS